MTKTVKKASAFSVPALSLLCLTVMCALQASAQQGPTGGPQVLSNAVVNEPIQFDVSPPLSQMLTQVPPQQGVQKIIPVLLPKLDKLKGFAQQRGSAPFSSPGPLISATIGLSFQGVGISSASTLNCSSVIGFGVAPPDTNAAVGDTQVVEWVNLCYAVFDKATGALIAGPFAGNNFWAGFGGACETANDGDPIIQWDKSNHRWLASQNVFGPYMTCIAVSQTADATGSYFRYAFTQPGFPDYPKWGLTPAVYYQTQNDFGANDGFVGVNVCAYDATSMLKGSKKASQVCILDNSNGTLFDDSMLPADLDSDPKKAKGAPEVFLGSIDNFNPGSNVYEYVFTVNFKKPAKSTLAGVNGTMPLAVPTYSLGCGGFGACIQQPPPGDLVDSLGDRLMYRLARFDDGTNQHFLVTHSVNNTTAVGARWYEFRAPSGSTSLSLYQSGDTPDDGEYRWMGSVAYDKAGDIALGYSRSSSASGDYPSIYYSGQTAGDPPGTTETEALIVQGGGSQQDTSDRWGDYSSMALDGADFCTFWYAQEYYPATDSFAWGTWLASLKFPNCQ
jgi:hypothetical protein